MAKWPSIVLLGAAVSFGHGCANTAMPRFCSPGTAQAQQARAELFDPYPQITSPREQAEMAGVRPLGYENPPIVEKPSPWASGPNRIAW